MTEVEIVSLSLSLILPIEAVFKNDFASCLWHLLILKFLPSFQFIAKMVQHTNAKFYFRQCSCGKVCRGEEMRKHVREQKKKGATDPHMEKAVAVLCINCAVRCEGDKVAFFERHATCPSGNVGNRFVKESIAKAERIEEAQRSLEVDFGVVDPSHPVDLDADLHLSSDSEEEFALVREMKASTPIPSTSEKEEEKKEEEKKEEKKRTTIKEQKSAARKDARCLSDAQQATIVRLKGRCASLKETNASLLRENEELRTKVSGIRELKYAEVTLKGKLMGKDHQIEKLKREKKDAEEDRRRFLERSEMAEVEMRRLFARVQELETEMAGLRSGQRREAAAEERVKTLEFHIPIMNNRVVDIPTMVEDLDATHICFDAPEKGVHCLHMMLKAGNFERLSFRRTKRKLPSK